MRERAKPLLRNCARLLDSNYFQMRRKKNRVIQLALQWTYRPALSRNLLYGTKIFPS